MNILLIDLSVATKLALIRKERKGWDFISSRQFEETKSFTELAKLIKSQNWDFKSIMLATNDRSNAMKEKENLLNTILQKENLPLISSIKNKSDALLFALVFDKETEFKQKDGFLINIEKEVSFRGMKDGQLHKDFYLELRRSWISSSGMNMPISQWLSWQSMQEWVPSHLQELSWQEIIKDEEISFVLKDALQKIVEEIKKYQLSPIYFAGEGGRCLGNLIEDGYIDTNEERALEGLLLIKEIENKKMPLFRKIKQRFKNE